MSHPVVGGGATDASTSPDATDATDATDSSVGGVPTGGGPSGPDGDGATPTPGLEGLADEAHAASASASATASALGGDEPSPAGAGELDTVRAELTERTADLQRVSAEFANYRRRVDREREQTVSAAKASVAGELLTVLDDLDRADKHGDLAGPVKAVADKLTETLHRVGLTPFGAEGDAFDPAVHEAVAHETSPDVSGPTVTTVMRRGYRFGDRVLRAAMVGVTDSDGTAPSSPETADTPASS